MRQFQGSLLFVLMLAGEAICSSQTASQTTVGGTADHGGGAPLPAATVPDQRSEKQKALAAETERLCDMAAELKVQVDKTNRNILSLTVVAKAEEIEALAKGMRGGAKKN